MALKPTKAPFIEPYALAGNPNNYKSKGPTAEAVKRALAHVGYLPWKGDWDQHWNRAVNEAAAHFKAKHKLIPKDSQDGSWGEGAHQAMRQATYERDGERLPAFDGYAQKLLQDEAGQSAGSGEEIVFQNLFVEFLENCVKNPDRLHYNNRHRPVDVTVDPLKADFVSDCSGIGIQAANYARLKSGLNVGDPAQFNFQGWGNTDDKEDDWPKVASPFRIGDAAHFSGPRHVIWCIREGDVNSALWFSFGSEPPRSFKLPHYSRYPRDFMFVVRPQYVD